MTSDEGIDIAVRLETAIVALRGALELAEKRKGAPSQDISAVLAKLLLVRLVCLKDVPLVKSLPI